MPQPDETMIDGWRRTWQGLGATADPHLFQNLIARYREPHRHYHTMQHIAECFSKLGELAAATVHREEVELAVWFHDAIYDVARQDNETRSADWARDAVLAAGLSAAIADRVHALVMATRHNAVPADTDQQILVDVDLAILGAEARRFDEYETQIRHEYAFIDDAAFARGRRHILAEFAKRPTLFNTRLFIDRYEARARTNLARSIARLA